MRDVDKGVIFNLRKSIIQITKKYKFEKKLEKNEKKKKRQ